MHGMTYLMNIGNLTAEGIILLFMLYWIFKMMGNDKLFHWEKDKGGSPIKGQSLYRFAYVHRALRPSHIMLIFTLMLIPLLITGTVHAETPDYAASVTAGGAATYYETLQSALNDGDGGTVTLLTDIDTDAKAGSWPLTAADGKTVTLELAGYKIDRGLTAAQDDGNVLTVNGTLTLTDSVGGGTITGGYNTDDGGGVIVSTGGCFIMNGGAIIANKSSGNGGGVYFAGTAFNMAGGIIGRAETGAGNSAKNGSGVYVNSGTFTMSGTASVSGNKWADTSTYSSSGGGIYVAGGSFSLSENAAITGNAVTNNGSGGGVYFKDGETFTMSGGTISGNDAHSGGAVYFINGTYNMTGGTIGGSETTDANTAQWGSGVYTGGEFYLSGGTITGNTSYFDYSSTGAIHVQGGHFYLKGDPEIFGNKRGTGETARDGNVFLALDKNIKVNGELTYSHKIGVSKAEYMVFTDTDSAYYGFNDPDKFSSDDPDYVVGRKPSTGSDHDQLFFSTPVTLTYDANGGTGEDVTKTYAAGSSVTVLENTFDGPDGQPFVSWNTAADGSDDPYIPHDTTSGSITINTDTTLYAQWTVASVTKNGKTTNYLTLQSALDAGRGGTVTLLTDIDSDTEAGSWPLETKLKYGGLITLDLNGNTISAAVDGAVINIINYVDLTLTDTSPDKTGKIINTSGTNACGVAVIQGDIFEMNGGTIESTAGKASGTFGVELIQGSFIMDGGTITGWDRGVNLSVILISEFEQLDEPSFVMVDGTISGNRLGVYAELDPGDSNKLLKVNMIGGTITGNISEDENSGYGGGVWINGSTVFNMHGGTISGNTWAKGSGAGVSVHGGTFNLSRGTITENTAAKGGGIYVGTDAAGTGSKFNLQGSPDISGNNGGNVYLDLDNQNDLYKITITGDLTPQNPIGITLGTEDGTGVFTDSGSSDIDKNQIQDFKSDKEGLKVGKNADGQLILGAPVTLAYDANGAGSGTAPADENSPYVSGTEVTVLGNSGNLAKDGYAFIGWNIKAAPTASDPGTHYDAEDSFTITGNTTLYAEWAVASVTKNGITTNYLTLQEALDAGDGSTVTLLTNIGTANVGEKGFPVSISGSKTVTLDLYGKTISAAVNNAVIKISNNASLTLTDGSKDKTGEVINAGNNYNTRGVVVDGGTFTVNSGTIKSTAGKAAGAWGIELNAGTFTMDGGTITGWGTGVNLNDYVASIAGNTVTEVFDMKGGSIEGNTTGVYAVSIMGVFDDSSGAVFNMTGGTISGNNSDEDPENNGNGGGVWIDAGAEFNMTGGTISGNTWAEGSGAGVGVRGGGIFNLSGGTITDNTAAKGGGIYVSWSSMGWNSELNLQGSPDISGNSGGNVYLDLDNQNVLYKITIVGGLDPVNPIGIKLGTADGTGVFTDSLDVTNNNKEVFFRETEGLFVGKNTAGQLLLGKEVPLTYNANTGTGSATKETERNVISGSAVTVLTAEEAGFENDGLPFVSWNTAADGSGTTYDPADPDHNTISIPEDPAQIPTLYAQWAAASVTKNGKTTNYSTLQSALNDGDGGTVTLLTDIDTAAEAGSWPLTAADGKTVTLELAGYKIDRGLTEAQDDGNVLTVNGNLTLTDSKGGGTITGGYNTDSGGVYVAGGSFIISGGTISGNGSDKGGGVYVASGSFTMSGGEITENKPNSYGDDVYVAGGSFTMSGGSISGNKDGGVYVGNGADFTMSGSSVISGNEKIYTEGSSGMGGGVYIDAGGSFTMSGGTISLNSADLNGGGVFVNTDATFNLKGSPVISGNTRGSGTGASADNVYLPTGKTITVTGKLEDTAKIGVTIANGTGVFTAGLEGKGGASGFSSDSSAYTVGLTEAGEAVLGWKVTYTADADGGTVTGTVPTDDTLYYQPGHNTVTVQPADGLVRTKTAGGVLTYETADGWIIDGQTILWERPLPSNRIRH